MVLHLVRDTLWDTKDTLGGLAPQARQAALGVQAPVRADGALDYGDSGQHAD